ncbi:MAG: nucleotidyl transferase AbiEii/AbiGii toxin family protein [Planctomycetes bacterium]|nr:nucleotidyl transferase AbiEii/AbiGii toxin family protein [Planctomycetota bacterium]
MTGKKNVADSVRELLRRHARPGSGGYLLTLKRYAIERLLYRISQSDERDRLILKGAMLFTLWGKEFARPTRDLDLLGSGPSSAEHFAKVFRDVCATPVDDDGLSFPAASIRADRILAGEEYVGVRLNLLALLQRSRIPVQVDIGFGDRVVPAPLLFMFPTLLNSPAPRIRAYPREAVVAEKLHAMIRHGDHNTRAKDFYDIHVLATAFPFEGALLAQSIDATFGRRATPIPLAPESSMTPEWYADSKRAEYWKAYLRRDELTGAPVDFRLLGEGILRFLGPPVREMGARKSFKLQWSPGGPWT